MKKVYNFILIPILSLLVLLTTFLVGCSNKKNSANNAPANNTPTENTPTENTPAENNPTYPQTFETDTSRDVYQELVDYINKNGNEQHGNIVELGLTPNKVFENEMSNPIADNIHLWYYQKKDIIEICADFYISIDDTQYHMFTQILIPKQSNYDSTNFTITGNRYYNFGLEYSATIPNTDKNFREQPHDPHPIRTIDFDSSIFDNSVFESEKYLTELALKLTKCTSAILPIFDNFFREKLKYFPDKLENGTVLPTEVSQYAILSYFHLPVAVKINPRIKN